MKAIAFFLAGFVFATYSAQGQDDKLKRDATYSTHNYKHANKAAEAARWANQAGTVAVTPFVAGAGQAGTSYKQPVPGVSAQASLSVPGSGPASLASRNYKISPVQQRQSANGTALTQQPAKSGTTGD